uniref:TBK1 binding protein 1 n=1 Tax=Oncorhynchus kisutch TaxID=8019 RepID=A0A8C7M3X3_ONCKI
MESLFGGELRLLGGGEGLKEDGCGDVGWSSSPLPEDMYSASHFTLITAYQDIKTRLAGLERENSGIKRKLKIYEIKFPMISEFGEDRNSYCSFESKENALLQSENGNLQQRVNALTHEAQKRKDREEQLEDVIQAYEKIHMEKSNLQRDLDKMTSLVEKHVERILGLESALRQRDNSLQKFNTQLIVCVSALPSPSAVLDCPALTLQNSRSLDTLSDLKLQRLEAELEGARHQAQGACQREQEVKAECERLQEELKQIQNNHIERCDVEWIKKVGDEQVNLALAYTELTEELGRLQKLSSKQKEILKKTSQEHYLERHTPVPQLSEQKPNTLVCCSLTPPVSSVSSVQRQSHPPSPIHHQRHSPVPQRHSPIPPQHHSPIPQRRSPVLQPQRLSPDMHRRSPLLEINDGPASYSCRPASHHLRASFQGRRSYSEVADPSAYQRPLRLSLDPVSTLPKPRPYRDSKLPFPLSEVSPRSHLHFEPPPPPTPAPQLPQSSEDEEEWTCPHPISPPRTLGVPNNVSPHGVMRGPASCSPFPIPSRPNTLTCHPSSYLHTEHAQSWPSINLWMETEESDMRSCPLCQLIFPIGYPDDALIKHIDSHLENSKI